ncbi:hypothetical protein WN944_020137 [Citrus x changshan-huyou]|uniref:F-box domain-containing protein n=1 Tax=Citrus x changshan-huyou TaxID=2935761 RepID=A0AAP0QEM6_9ROSI
MATLPSELIVDILLKLPAKSLCLQVFIQVMACYRETVYDDKLAVTIRLENCEKIYLSSSDTYGVVRVYGSFLRLAAVIESASNTWSGPKAEELIKLESQNLDDEGGHHPLTLKLWESPKLDFNWRRREMSGTHPPRS